MSFSSWKPSDINLSYDGYNRNNSSSFPSSNEFSFSKNQKLGALGVGAGLSAFNDFFNNNNPSDDAAKYYDQIPEQMAQYYQPYIDSGKRTIPKLEENYDSLTGGLPDINNQYSRLIHDPSGFMSEIGSKYEKSPAYQYALSEGLNGANNAAAAGGMSGSPMHQRESASIASGLAKKDYYDYLDHALNLYGQGLGGKTSLFNRGLEGRERMNDIGNRSATSFADNIAQSLMSRGNLAYEGSASQNQRKGQGIGNLASFSTLAAFLPD
jgi:hypothetical protein